MADLEIRGEPSSQPCHHPPRTPSPPSTTPSPPRALATHELDAIDPNTAALEKHRSRDEDSVNMALVLLLDTVTICSGINKIAGRQGLSWMATRQAFNVGPASNPVCEARTDGVLVTREHPPRTLAILEVKPFERNAGKMTRNRIEWQEACQMAAWISDSLSQKTAEKRNEGVLRLKNGKKGYVVSSPPTCLFVTI